MSMSRHSRPKFMDLPTDVHSEILSKFSDTRLYSFLTPSQCIDDAAIWILPKLSDDLLNCAKASPILAEAAISTLGKVKILSNRSTSRLAEWVHILQYKIKALSLTGYTDIGYCSGDCRKDVCQCNHLYDETIKTLKALHMTEVKLEALNLEDIKLITDEKSAEIEDCMAQAIQKSGPSLKYIALNANLVSARALKHVSLPKLEVAQIRFEDFMFPYNQIGTMERRSCAETYHEMLKALDGHADRNSNKSSLKELRLLDIQEAPKVDHETCPSLFLTVEKLILMCELSSSNARMTSFIANFKNLRTLHWVTGETSANDMNTIFQGCRFLDKIILDFGTNNLFRDEISVTKDFSLFRDLFMSFRGKLRSLQLGSYLNSEQLIFLGQSCPNLTSLTVDIGPENLRGLHSLLRTHCRTLRELYLFYTRNAYDCLGGDGWVDFSQAICGASNNLSVISLFGDRDGPMFEHATTDMIQAVAGILEFMSDRARIVVFQVPLASPDLKVILAGLHHVLYTGMNHCKSLDYLCLDFFEEYPESIWADDGEVYDLFNAIIDLREQYEALPNVNRIELGRIHELIVDPYIVVNVNDMNLEDIWPGFDERSWMQILARIPP